MKILTEKAHDFERRLKDDSINFFNSVSVLTCVASHCPVGSFQLIHTLKRHWFSQSLFVSFCIKEIVTLTSSWVSDFLFFFLFYFWIGGAKHKKKNIAVHPTFLSFWPSPIFQFLCEYCSSSSKSEPMSAHFWGILDLLLQIEERFLYQSVFDIKLNIFHKIPFHSNICYELLLNMSPLLQCQPRLLPPALKGFSA